MKLTPIAVWRIRAWPAAGICSGTVSNCSFSGPPSSWTTIALGMPGPIYRELSCLPRANARRARCARSAQAEQDAQLLGDPVAAAGAARSDEDGVVAGQRPHHLGEAGLVERARHGGRGARLGAHDDQRAVGFEAFDQAPNRFERQGAAAVDQVPWPVGSDRTPHAD